VRILFSRVDLCQWILGPASQGTVLDRFPTAACIKFLRPRAQGFSRACTVTRSWVDFGSLLIVSAALIFTARARAPACQFSSPWSSRSVCAQARVRLCRFLSGSYRAVLVSSSFWQI
jgi:hypothetical protein